MIDGDAVWSSQKLRTVEPEQFRAEYTNLLPLALANGVFELDVDQIWLKVYAYLRPHFSREDVAAVLKEFQRVGLIFKFEHSGREWGYFVGIEKPGRLPSNGHKNRYKVGPSVPRKELLLYIEQSQLVRSGVRITSGLYPDKVPHGLDWIGKDRKGSQLQTLPLASLAPSETPSEAERTFALFWEEYPRKVGKPAARKVWEKIFKHSELILAGLRVWKSCDQWVENGERFIPHPATFLTQQRYNDKPTNGAHSPDPFDPVAIKREREKYDDLMRRAADSGTKPVGRSVR